jgi:hypothetical protein
MLCAPQQVGADGKPTKGQRRKHQISQLAFDVQATEADFLDRKGARVQTKSQTQAKYGW